MWVGGCLSFSWALPGHPVSLPVCIPVPPRFYYFLCWILFCFQFWIYVLDFISLTNVSLCFILSILQLGPHFCTHHNITGSSRKLVLIQCQVKYFARITNINTNISVHVDSTAKKQRVLQDISCWVLLGLTHRNPSLHFYQYFYMQIRSWSTFSSWHQHSINPLILSVLYFMRTVFQTTKKEKKNAGHSK